MQAAATIGGTTVVNGDDPQARSVARAYVLLRAVPGARPRLVQTLLKQPGVVTVDEVEGPLDIVLVVEGPDRPRLARTMMRALASVEMMFDGLETLPAQRRRPGRQKAGKADAGGHG